ncbi:hypothetical protein KQX54_003952 [Cotesia glomerata]|uniref:Uncharacterized protein n=1 Tax=Cotesia glomerata TaxID=32391 RepID=A0AAV7HY05_COTGL|nr:hypothetical protein KQX54_003952 [Cotesia glomerata]
MFEEYIDLATFLLFLKDLFYSLIVLRFHKYNTSCGLEESPELLPPGGRSPGSSVASVSPGARRSLQGTGFPVHRWLTADMMGTMAGGIKIHEDRVALSKQIRLFIGTGTRVKGHWVTGGKRLQLPVIINHRPVRVNKPNHLFGDETQYSSLLKCLVINFRLDTPDYVGRVMVSQEGLLSLTPSVVLMVLATLWIITTTPTT